MMKSSFQYLNDDFFIKKKNESISLPLSLSLSIYLPKVHSAVTADKFNLVFMY